jgi:dTDP-4-dehydrorhamnose reductase
MRILITEVTGQVGRALLSALAPVGSLIAVDRNKLDLSRGSQIASTLDDFAPDLSVNPAAYTAVDRAEEEGKLAFRINAEAPAAIARWAASSAVPLIHFSTDYVFDGVGERPWREDDKTNPLSVYGASKLAGEEAVRSAGGAHLIIRTCWVYSTSGTNFVRTIARLARERETLRVVANQVGAPTSARLIAAAVAEMIRPGNTTLAERFSTARGLVNLAATGATSWHGFATAIVGGLNARGVALTIKHIVPIATGSIQPRPGDRRTPVSILRGSSRSSELNRRDGMRPSP